MTALPLTFAGDEAGDTGFRFNRGATRYFVMALISTRRPETLREALRRLRQNNSLPAGYEFSFHDTTSRRLPDALSQTLQRLDFQVWAVVVDKKQLTDSFLAMPSRSFYVFFVTEVIQLIPKAEREEATLLLDEFDRSGKTLAELKRVLKLRGIRRGFRKIRPVRSRSEDLVQIADWVAGSILRRYAKQDDRAYRVIEPRVQVLLDFQA
jgi:hypothetical protein